MREVVGTSGEERKRIEGRGERVEEKGPGRERGGRSRGKGER